MKGNWFICLTRLVQAIFEAIEGSSTLVVTFTSTIGGKLVELRKTFTDIEAGQHHKLTFKAKDGNGTIPDELWIH